MPEYALASRRAAPPRARDLALALVRCLAWRLRWPGLPSPLSVGGLALNLRIWPGGVARLPALRTVRDGCFASAHGSCPCGAAVPCSWYAYWRLALLRPLALAGFRVNCRIPRDSLLGLAFRFGFGFHLAPCAVALCAVFVGHGFIWRLALWPSGGSGFTGACAVAAAAPVVSLHVAHPVGWVSSASLRLGWVSLAAFALWPFARRMVGTSWPFLP